MQISILRGVDVQAHLDDLARLRMQVFREYPYLYDGDLAYERRYVATYARSPGSLFVLARDAGRIVGVSTGVPLVDEDEAILQSFRAVGIEPAKVFYFGESVLLPVYRGRGIGVCFFEAREAHARQLGGLDYCAFCAVERPGDHPRRPANYRSLRAFWASRGYRHQPQLRTTISWKDLDEPAVTAKPMSFWLKVLKP